MAVLIVDLMPVGVYAFTIKDLQIIKRRCPVTTRKDVYAAIAQRFRNQPYQEVPLKHEWVELLSHLVRHDNKNLQEIGIRELTNSVELSVRYKSR